MGFSKNHLRDPNNSNDFRSYRRTVFRAYANFLRERIQTNYDWAVKFIMWLRQYLYYLKMERSFSPTYLPRYTCGQIILINFGFRLGNEIGGAHYGIVLDNDNRKKSGFITIVPMISKKKRHFDYGLSPWEYELPFPISQLIIDKALKQIADTPSADIYDDIIKAMSQGDGNSSNCPTLPDTITFDKQLQKRVEPLFTLAQKMSKGSIVDTRQIITVSKIRIITPVKAADELTNICIPCDSLQQIREKIAKNYILPAESLDNAANKQ